jgi:hypothetical protein
MTSHQHLLTKDCGDKKNRNPHVFPIFPVDYPFIKKGHRFTTDANTQARPKTVWLVREFERTAQVITGTAGVPPEVSAKREKNLRKRLRL